MGAKSIASPHTRIILISVKDGKCRKWSNTSFQNSYHLLVHLGGIDERWGAFAMTQSSWLFNKDAYLFAHRHSSAAKDSAGGVALFRRSSSRKVLNSWSFHVSCHPSKWTHQKIPRNGQGSAATWAGSTLWVRLRASPLSLATLCLHSAPGSGSLVLMRCTLKRFARWTWVSMIQSAITYRHVFLSHLSSFTIASD